MRFLVDEPGSLTKRYGLTDEAFERRAYAGEALNEPGSRYGIQV